MRCVACSSSTSSSRSAPLATSHNHRAAGRSPTAAVVSASSSRQFTDRPRDPTAPVNAFANC